MADGFIVRKGGVGGEPIPQPTITLVSKTDSSITFTLTNNSIAEQDVTFGLTTPPTTTTITLASLATSSNQIFTGFTPEQTVTIFAQAGNSAISQLSVTTNPITFTAATGGTTAEYDDGGKRFKSHTFNSSGTFEVTTAGNGDRNEVDYLIIAGGGGGGRGGGGGGAGGYRTTVGDQGGLGTLDPNVVVTAQDYTIIVGLGGNGGTSSSGSNGANSAAFNIASTGGGGGGGASDLNGKNGGSGGGPGRSFDALSGGSGTTNQGFSGGDNNTGELAPSGGGGGAGAVGQTAPSGTKSGAGGNGLANLLRTGSNETRAGGGGGGGRGATGGAAGSGGGGTGGGAAGTNGTTNTGSGGGGGGQNADTFVSSNGGAGGSGLVVIRYEIAPSV